MSRVRASRVAAVGAEVLTSDAKSLGLDPRLVAVDALKLVSLAESTDPADLARAADLYRGDFSPAST
jgi:hypothetical protein